VFGVPKKLVKNLIKKKNSSQKLLKLQSTSFWSQGILGIKRLDSQSNNHINGACNDLATSVNYSSPHACYMEVQFSVVLSLALL
jgi:hypothetical protein